MMLRCHPEAALDAVRMAALYALRRDWAPYPSTQPWQPDVQYVLATVVEEIGAEALALVGRAERV